MYYDRNNPAVAPAEALVSTDDAKLFLHVDADTEDDLIDELVSAATNYAEIAIAQQFVTATRDFYGNVFPNRDYIEVDLPPLQSVTYVKYYDTAGDLQTFSSDNYSVDTIRKPGRINLGYGQSWPSTYAIPNAIQVRAVCGYGDAADVPENIVLAVKTLLHDYHENRATMGQMPAQVYRLLSISSHGPS